MQPTEDDQIKARGPLDHYDAFAPGSCICAYCEEAKQAAAALKAIENQIAATPCDCERCQQYVPGTLWAHSRGCPCPLCQKAEAAFIQSLAAQNRRDLWSEMSFHATHDKLLSRKGLGMPLMEWVGHEMKQVTSNYWWAIRGANMSMGDWLEKFEAAVIAVSGGALRCVTVAVTG